LAFVRRRGNSHQLIEAYRTGGKVRQRILANLGPPVQQRSRPTERWLPRRCDQAGISGEEFL
jgi:hypothetical protein